MARKLTYRQFVYYVLSDDPEVRGITENEARIYYSYYELGVKWANMKSIGVIPEVTDEELNTMEFSD